MMNNTKSVKNTNNSPKTPGGISKSYLTPVRRVGLSRNFRKNGRSPFISPLSTHNSETDTNKPDTECKKRKKISSDEENKNDIDISLTNENFTGSPSCYTPITSDINGTPSRNLLIKKKSKTLFLSNDCIEEPISEDLSGTSNNIKTDCNTVTIRQNSPKKLNNKVAKLCRSNSINNNKVNDLPLKVEHNKKLTKDEVRAATDTERTMSPKNEKKSPNNLTKECVVVIQNKLIKSISKDKIKFEDDSKTKLKNPVSQILFDSDSEDIPLSKINKKQNYSTNINKVENNINNNSRISMQEDDFQKNVIEVKKLVDKSTSVSELKANLKEKKAFKKKMTKPPIKIENTPSSQSSNSYDDDDDDDFQFDKKKTIIIKKCYNKVIKPSKAKSTGSITKQDIEEMKEKIETKKKLLLAKSLTKDTLELRDLIKKWKKGCQNALTELLELMKKKMPDKQNMEYSEILQILKIPPDLVGYDSENDCFVTPDDATIVLSSLNVK